jgi:hypothetical protein
MFNWGNKFNITMRLDTHGMAYATGMPYKDAPTFWRETPIKEGKHTKEPASLEGKDAIAGPAAPGGVPRRRRAAVGCGSPSPSDCPTHNMEGRCTRDRAELIILS